MATVQTSKGSLDKINTQIAQLQAKKKSLLQKERLKEKKEREKLLISYGEIVEKYLPDCKTPDDLKAYFERSIFTVNSTPDTATPLTVRHKATATKK